MRGDRLSADAKADIAAILRTSRDLHGEAARVRYRGLIAATLRRIASDPEAIPTLDRGIHAPGLRSLHTLYGRDRSQEARVAATVHIVYFKVVDARTVAIVRVLHERMQPGRHLAGDL